MLVLVVGASGTLGREAVRALHAAGHRVRGMTRSPERIRVIELLGGEATIGDLTDPPSLARACSGVDAVLAAAHGALGRGRYTSAAVDDAGHRALVDAARAAGVGRFVYVSALGAAPDHPVDFFRTKWSLEQYLAASGLDYVVLRPSAFMEQHVHAFNGKRVLERGTAVVLGPGRKLRNFVAAPDVAQVAVRMLAEPAPAERVVAVVGPGDATNDDVARLYARVAGVPARIVHVPRAVLATIAAVARPLHPGVARALRLVSLPDDAFPEAHHGSTGAQVVGATTLEAFVRARVLGHAAAPRAP